MNERFYYTGPGGILDGVGHVDGPGEVMANPDDPRIKRLVANGELTVGGEAPAVAKKVTKDDPAAEVYTEAQLNAMNKAELFEIAELMGIDTEQSTLKADLVEMILVNQE